LADDPERKTVPCSFCGKLLKIVKRQFGDKTFCEPMPCDCAGYVANREKTRREQEAAQMKMIAARSLANKIKNAGIAKRYLQAVVYGIFEQAAASIIAGGGKGLYITGIYGSGKTYAASAVVIEVLKAGKTAEIIGAIELLGSIKATFGKDSSEQEIIGRLSRLDLLVIDDLGKEHPTAWVMQQLYEIIDQRYKHSRATIITTNYLSSELIQKWAATGDAKSGEAIISRLHEMCRRVDMGSVDRRRDIGQKQNAETEVEE
jgi:DNA replication protein DnaC